MTTKYAFISMCATCSDEVSAALEMGETLIKTMAHPKFHSITLDPTDLWLQDEIEVLLIKVPYERKEIELVDTGWINPMGAERFRIIQANLGDFKVGQLTIRKVKLS